MKHLKIEYTTESGSKITLFDDEVAEVTWSDGNGVVRVEGKTQAASGGLNLLEMLTGGSKARTEAAAEEKRAEYEAEKKATAAARKPKPKPVVIEADQDAPMVDLADEIV